MLHIYNSLTKRKEVFKPIQPGKVNFYVCGPTVYDFCHIGHARTYLAFDTIKRYMEYQGLEVRYVRNITDIDDKIIKRAVENNEPISQLTVRFTKSMHEDFKQLNITPPNVEPRATEYIPQMIHMIQDLLDKGFAYIGETQDVYYDVRKFESYGCLSHRDIEDLQAGARVEVNEAKRCPLDFVLWKMSKPDEPSWESPWGHGRPGWHIECSAMSLHNLGETLDIHGGGTDLKFPHHENERAQSEAASHKTFANVWMHTGFVQLDKEKMSKSLGNFLTIREFLENHHPEVLRYFSISSHYRSPVDYTVENIDLAFKGLERLYSALVFAYKELDIAAVVAPKNTEYEQRFQEAMNDDFNTPLALSVLFDLVREINRLRDIGDNSTEIISLSALLVKLGNLLGLLYSKPQDFLQNLQGKEITPEEIQSFIEARNQARATKDWPEADRIRKLLLSKGIIIEDKSGGTVWSVKT